jgi:arylsulfatase A-like enzyme
MTLFGQSCLTARRMLDAGTRLVSVFWDEYGLAGDAWDTHWNHFPRMTDQLLPGLDKAFSGLIVDLDQRGQLDDTLVVCISEHGRTPKINSAKGGGRDHWSQAYSVLFAGGGIARGRIVGATDKYAGEVVSNPVGPKDVLATMYHLLGIEPHIFLPDRTGRPIPLVPESSRVITELLA